MKKTFRYVAAFLLCFSMIRIPCMAADPAFSSGEDEHAAVSRVVLEFGQKMKMVSLLAPPENLAKSITDSYGSLVSPALLKKWLADPKNAPGRVASSPWPDRIDIKMIKKRQEGVYTVRGLVIEITSTEVGKDRAAALRPVMLVVKKQGNRWLIDEATFGKYFTARKHRPKGNPRNPKTAD